MRFLVKIKQVFKVVVDCLKFGGTNTIQVHQIDRHNELQGKTILVTGAGSGIGFSIAKKCVDSGAEVVITGRNEEKLKKAVRQMNTPNVKFLVWDISDISMVEEKLKECQALLGKELDVLVNNAGIQPHEFFPDVTEAEWDRIYDTNSKGTFFVSECICRQWMEHPVRNKYRKIINIDSQGGFVGADYPYRMSKWDIRGFTVGLGLKMAHHGVIVNGIAPGVVKTEMQKFSMEQGENTYCTQNPLSRVALPEEIAELAVFMISDACNFMVGQTILVDGGYSLK